MISQRIVFLETLKRLCRPNGEILIDQPECVLTDELERGFIDKLEKSSIDELNRGFICELE